MDALSMHNVSFQHWKMEFGQLHQDSKMPESEEPRPALPVLFKLEDLAATKALRLTNWLKLVRKRSGWHHSTSTLDQVTSGVVSSRDEVSKNYPALQVIKKDDADISLSERLDRAAVMDIESESFSWDMLSSLHHPEYNSSIDNSEDESGKAFEVTVNSGGVVFFALFNLPAEHHSFPNEAAAVIKFSSSRIATQSEQLGYEFAKQLGIKTPQARIIHNVSKEWLQIKEAAGKARMAASSIGDETGEAMCSELLEALELSKCLFLMSYMHGWTLLDSTEVLESRRNAEMIAEALGRVLMLDLVIRNEDRLPCHSLNWRGNLANLILADRRTNTDSKCHLDSHNPIFAKCRQNPSAFQKERRAISADCRLNHNFYTSHSCSSGLVPASDPVSSENGFQIVVIDSGVPRRPPVGKRADDHERYPRLVELLLNSIDYSSSLLYEITAGKLGYPMSGNSDSNSARDHMMNCIVQEFRNGFRSALRDVQSFHLFLLTLHQKLDNALQVFLNISNKISSSDFDKEDFLGVESPSGSNLHFCSPSKECHDCHSDLSDSEMQKTAPKPSSAGSKEAADSSYLMSKEAWHGKCPKGSADQLRSQRLTMKLRDVHKFAKADTESGKELEQWNGMLRNDIINLCAENNFNTGFFEGSDKNIVVDAYELKVRLEHILERISLISDAANTEKPSSITDFLFIGGALAARSFHTLQHLGITHLLCLCANEIGQSDSQRPDLFEYRNFSIHDDEETNICSIFEEAADFIDNAESVGGKVLVHCFEGRSRSATLVIAYLMLRKNLTLLEAWNMVRQAHRRAQPNDGFARTLLDLDQKLHGKVSMEWQQRKPVLKVCPMCGKNTGLSSISLKLHLQKCHREISSGSVDSALTIEIEKALGTLIMTRNGSFGASRELLPVVNR